MTTSYQPPRSRSCIHIVFDDHPLAGQVKLLVELEGFDTLAYPSLDHLHDLVEALGPRDVVLIDMTFGGICSLAVLRHLLSVSPNLKIIMIAADGPVDPVIQALKLGAADVVAKPFLAERLADALRLVSGAPSQPLVRHAAGEDLRDFSSLTPREREVLNLVVNGHSSKEAGRCLGISPKTVEVHRARVMEKLFAKNTADLLRIVLTNAPRTRAVSH